LEQIQIEKIANSFISAGGKFVATPEEIRRKLLPIKAFVFDWDGVFNNGNKDINGDSPFSESDSMGTNLLRFGYWLLNGSMPLTAIITGQNNQTALEFAKRENFDDVFANVKDKTSAFTHFTLAHNLKPEEVLFVYDDVLDLPVANICGVRFFVKNGGTLLMREFVEREKMADYVTANTGGSYAVREVAELLLGLKGVYSEVLHHRIKYSDTYTAYLKKRYSHHPRLYTLMDGEIKRST